ncbi:hypothetical protein [Hymenobacter sp. 102]|uniref:hypothetical protein n=1 Tax=Hymenobacter sp. 102 TaxID=3403152 RepID=UPI003CF9ABE9
MKFVPSITARYQLNEKLSFSTGYSGGAAGFGYKLKIPDNITHNDFGGAWNSAASATYIDRIPSLVNYRFHQFNFTPIDTDKKLYNYSIKFDITAGVCVNRIHSFTNSKLALGPVFLKDTIDFNESNSQIVNRWGGYATLGATARFYHLGKERMNVSLFINQGFTDLMHTQLDYTYNSRTGTQLFRSRGSGVGFAVGIPLLLKTFETKAKPAP